MESFSDEIAISFASFLPPRDLVSLSLSCKRFGARCDTVTSRTAWKLAREAKRQKTGTIRHSCWSLMEKAAQQAIDAVGSDDEKNALPRRGEESWIGIYQDLQLLRAPLIFDQIIGDGIDYAGENKNTVDGKFNGHEIYSSAISQHVMRAGKHCVSFHVNGPGPILLGIMRPIDNLSMRDLKLKECHPVNQDLSSFSREHRTRSSRKSIDCCMMDVTIGDCLCRYSPNSQISTVAQGAWMEGSSGTYEIGFVLDLDEGSLTVYKNGRRLRTMRDRITGEYCWVASLRTLYRATAHSSVSVCRGVI